jgi:hypothetical protein
MLFHPKLKEWLKCPTCAYCRKEKPVITLEKYLMGRADQYPRDYTSDIEKNAKTLIQRVNTFLEELGVDKAEVSSGWRPPSINASTKGASKKSSHMTGEAVDLKDDKDQTLAKLILQNKDLLVKHDLYLEDPSSTIGQYTNWVHLQTRKTASGNRIFKP